MSWWRRRQQQFVYRQEVHAHLLPGLDDGAETLMESLLLIRRLKALGVERFSLTPHIAFPAYPNSRSNIFPALQEVRGALGPSFAVEAGAEYRITGELPELIERGELLPFHEDHLLIEHSLMAESVHFEPVVFGLLNKGIVPVLAHPERYPFFHGHIVERCRTIRQHGCLLQVNLLSFAGFYGKACEKAAWQLLKAGLVDYVGSDMHSARYADALEDFLYSATAGKLGRYTFRNS